MVPLMVPLMVMALACGDDKNPSVMAAGSSGAVITTTVIPPADSADDSSGSTPIDPSGSSMAQCSIYDQDCPVNEKCVPWSDQPDLVPDDIRCCPLSANAAMPGDPCEVEGYFGSCLDNCDEESFCIDLDGDGQGFCQAFCNGSAANPECEVRQSCLIYFAGVPLCFDVCDPLIQNCPQDRGCYPDEEANGGTGFICMPTLLFGDGDFGDYCWLLSGCQPGLLCVTPEFMPNCDGIVGCCSPLCEIDEPDPCPSFDPDLRCVSWYAGGASPPAPELDQVGICALPQ